MNNMKVGKEPITQFVDPGMMRKIKDDLTLDLLLERSNPMKEKYYQLTKEADESVARELQPSPDE